MRFLRPGEHRTGFVEPTRGRETKPVKQKRIWIVVNISRPGPVLMKMRTGRAKCTDRRALTKPPRQCRRCRQAWKARPLRFRSFQVSLEQRFVVSTQASWCNSATKQAHKAKTTHQIRWVRLQ